jgi:arginyl-tRNA synthetase
MHKLASKLHNLWTLGKGDPKLRFIIESEKELSFARLALVKSISHILFSGFKILGIEPMKQV